MQGRRTRVGLLTTWNTRCGISEYSRSIADGLADRADIDLVVLGSINEGRRKVRDDEPYVRPVFQVGVWYGVEPQLDVDAILALDLDVLHVQYQQAFFDAAPLRELLSRFSGPKLVTYHDNVFPPGFPSELFDMRYTHREGVGRGRCLRIPLGIERHAPVVKTFGLGRSRDDLVADICDRHGWRFEKFFGGADKTWLEAADLYAWLRDSDAIVLWYDPSPNAGSSAAARIAISTRRPVFCNDTEWFDDLPRQEANFTKVSSQEDLEGRLARLFLNELVDRSDWELVVERHVHDYRRLLGAAIPEEPPPWPQTPPLASEQRRAVVRPVPGLVRAVRPSTAADVLVEVENHTGADIASAAWNPVQLAYVWEDEEGRPCGQGLGDLPRRIEPGGMAFARLPIAAPSEEGTYVLRLSLSQDEELFGTPTDWTTRVQVNDLLGEEHLQTPYAALAPQDLQATVTAEVPNQARAGGELVTTCLVHNRGTQVLAPAEPHPVHVAYRWFGADGGLVLEGDRSQCPRALDPGEEASTSLAIRTPEAPGDYELRITLVQEHVAWFDEVSGENASRHLVTIAS